MLKIHFADGCGPLVIDGWRQIAAPKHQSTTASKPAVPRAPSMLSTLFLCSCCCIVLYCFVLYCSVYVQALYNVTVTLRGVCRFAERRSQSAGRRSQSANRRPRPTAGCCQLAAERDLSPATCDLRTANCENRKVYHIFRQ